MSDSTKTTLVVLPAKQLRLDCDPRGFGGIYKAALTQVEALISTGTRVSVLTASKPFFEEARHLGADCYFHPHWHSSILPLVNPRCWRQSWNVRRSRPIAALHHSGRTWPWAKILFCGIRNIGILHTGTTHRTKHFRYQFALSKSAHEALQVEPSNQKYIFRCIKNGLFTKEVRQVATITDIPSFDETRPLRLGYLGRVCHDKGIDVLLKAVAIAKKRGLTVTLSITGENHPEYIALARDLGISEIVSFHEWTDDPDKFYSAIDTFCLASRIEPFGLVVLEAMGCGLPVLASNCDGPSEIIQHGKSGLLFPVEDSNSLAALIEQIYQRPSLCRFLGEGARQRIVDEYSPRAVGISILRAISSLSNSTSNVSSSTTAANA